ncbi:MAG: YceI family protein [Ferruginibacter sp.]
MKRKRLFLLACLLSCFVNTKAQKEMKPSDDGSKVHFVIKNFGIKTGGDFSGLKGTIKFDPKNPAGSSFDVTVNSSTIDTDNGSRDGHLKKSEYFDVKQYPTIHMASTKVQATVKPGRYIFTGNLTIKKTTKPISFQFVAEEKDGGYLFTSDNIPLNRRDYGVGGSSVSMADELKLTLSVLAK